MKAARIQWRIRKTANGYEGMVALPLSLATIAQAHQRMTRSVSPQTMKLLAAQRKPVATKAKGATKADAMSKAMSAAESVLENPLVQAAMPPQAAAALRAAKVAADLVKSDQAKAAMKAAGKAGSGLVKALTSLW